MAERWGKLRMTTTHLLKQRNLYYFLLHWHNFLLEAELSSHGSKVEASRWFTNGLPGMISLSNAPTVFRHTVMSGKGNSRHHLLQHTQFSLCRWDPTCFQRTFSLSGSALWPEGSRYTQLANRRFLLLNARLVCLTNSSSQAASTPPVCLRVMAYVTPEQILKVCSSQLVSLCWWDSQRPICNYCDWRVLSVLGLLLQLKLAHILKVQWVIAILHGAVCFIVAPHSKT